MLLYHWWLFQTLTPFAIIKATLNQMKKESYLNWQLIQIFLNSKISIQERTYCSDSKTLAYLPSLFHLEVLLMAFHSSNAFEKIKMAENIFSTLSNVSCPPVLWIWMRESQKSMQWLISLNSIMESIQQRIVVNLHNPDNLCKLNQLCVVVGPPCSSFQTMGIHFHGFHQ